VRCSIPLRVSVIANFVPSTKPGTTSISGVDPNLLRQFDLIYMFDDIEKSIEDIYSILTEDMVSQSNSRVLPKFDPVKHAQLSHLVNSCSALAPKFSQEAHLMLKRFYVAVRQIRPTECHQEYFHSLVKIATSHAKLAKHLEVTVSDALIAIELVEETVLRKTLASVFGWKATAKRNIEIYGSDIKSQYLGFYKHVTQFNTLHSMGFHINEE